MCNVWNYGCTDFFFQLKIKISLYVGRNAGKWKEAGGLKLSFKVV